jgi:hypothetical protein
MTVIGLAANPPRGSIGVSAARLGPGIARMVTVMSMSARMFWMVRCIVVPSENMSLLAYDRKADKSGIRNEKSETAVQEFAYDHRCLKKFTFNKPELHRNTLPAICHLPSTIYLLITDN